MRASTGFSLDEAKGMNWVETFVHPQDRHTVGTILQETLSDSQPVETSIRLPEKTDERFLLSGTTKPSPTQMAMLQEYWQPALILPSENR